MPLSDVERIEIVRGAQSALYGSDGMGGVINVITPRPRDEVSVRVRASNSSLPRYRDPQSSASPGAFDQPSPAQEQNVNATVQFPTGAVAHRVTGALTRSNMYLNETESASVLPEMFRVTAGVESAIPVGDATDLRLGGGVTSMRADEQTSAQGSLLRREVVRYEGHVSATREIGYRLSLATQVYNHYYGRTLTPYSGILNQWQAGEEEFENLLAGDAIATIDVRPGLMVVTGVEASFNTMERETLTLGDVDRRVSRNGQAVLLQAEWYDEARYSVVAGVRAERDSKFGFAAAPRLAGMYHVTPAFRLLSGIGMGYRAPDFNDLYRYADPAPAMPIVITGNPDLQPEYSVGGSLGAEFVQDRLFAQVQLFHTELFNEIVFRPTGEIDDLSGKPIDRAENVARSSRTGVDLEARTGTWSRGFAGIGYGFVYGYDRTEGARLRDQPAHTVRGRFGHEGERFTAQAAARYFSPVTGQVPGAGGDPSLRREHRHQVDLFASYAFTNRIQAFAVAENITGYINPALGPFVGPRITLGTEISY